MDNNEIRYDNQKIVDVEINKEVRKAFLDYSMSVIVSRYTAVFFTPCLRTTCTRIGRTESAQTP